MFRRLVVFSFPSIPCYCPLNLSGVLNDKKRSVKDWVIRKATDGWKGAIQSEEGSITNLRFADDTIIFTNPEEEMHKSISRIDIMTKKKRLVWN